MLTSNSSTGSVLLDFDLPKVFVGAKLFCAFDTTLSACSTARSSSRRCSCSLVWDGDLCCPKDCWDSLEIWRWSGFCSLSTECVLAWLLPSAEDRDVAFCILHDGAGNSFTGVAISICFSRTDQVVIAAIKLDLKVIGFVKSMIALSGKGKT